MAKKIKRYQIRKMIGRGAMANVYEAYDPRIDRLLAIKLLREEHCVDAEYLLRFLREAKAVGNLSHPHIVTVYDVDKFENRPFIVMELLPGTPLNELIKSGQALSLKNIVNIGIQLASALNFAHQKGIVHRDVKPSNIICNENLTNVKITDFGIAHFNDTDLTQQTSMGEVLGTPQYMSPEQVQGAKVDGRSDLFSVGVILYQLLTGQRPFLGDTITSLMYKITNETPIPVTDFDNSIPSSLVYIVDKLLSKNPKDRFQTGNELITALEHSLRDIEKPRHKDEKRIIPIRVKWSLLMASIVSITMLTSIAVFFENQYRSMLQQMNDYGNSLVTFVATESAVPVLSEDWISIELFVKEANERQNFSYLTIVDHKNIVRGSNDITKIGKPYNQVLPTKIREPLFYQTPQIFAQLLSDEVGIADFATPILFQKKTIGSVHLGISKNSLHRITEVTFYMMSVLLIVTISVVLIFSYMFGRYFSIPITMTKKALEEISAGHYFSRINQKRNDEFGQLFETFNHMSEVLQRQFIKQKTAQETDVMPTFTTSNTITAHSSPSHSSSAPESSTVESSSVPVPNHRSETKKISFELED